MQALILQLTNLTSRIKSNIKIINGNKYLDVYLIDEFFRFTNTNWKEIRNDLVKPYFLELQKIIVDEILLEIIVGGQKGSLYNSMMTYNATCTEEDIHRFYGIPYGGNGDVEHLCIHTGYGNGTSDLDSGCQLRFLVIDNAGNRDFVTAGPKFEVKDYQDFNSAQYYFKKDAETTVYHDSTHVFLHILDADTYYIAENKKTSKWYQLEEANAIVHYRKQVKLWLDPEGLLCVQFR